MPRHHAPIQPTGSTDSTGEPSETTKDSNDPNLSANPNKNPNVVSEFNTFSSQSQQPRHTGAFESPVIAEQMKQRRQLADSQEWIVDRIFPAGAMHLIGGPSGVGKTTWLFQMLYEWEQGAKLFGEYDSHPVPWVYISCDRSMREMQQTLERLDIGDWEFEAYSLEQLIWDKSIKGCKSPNFADHILRKFPYAKLIVLEGLQAVMPDNSKARSQNKNELLWALEQRYVLSEGNRTVIASTHNPKVNQAGTMTVDDRSKFLGSQGFIGSCSTMISLEKGKMPEDRLMTIMGRNFADIKLTYSQKKENNGRFVLEGRDGTVVASETDDHIQFMTWCQSQPEPFTVKDAIACGMRIGVSDSTVERWLLEFVNSSLLERFREGRRFLYTPHASSVQ